MLCYSIRPSAIKGNILAPPSKSQTMRAILFASLARGTSRLFNCLLSPDTSHMLHACSLIGAKIKQDSLGTIEIKGIGGNISSVEDVIQAGNSGIILRFFSAILALSSSYSVITGDSSLRHQRPMSTTLSALQQLGVFAKSSRGDGFSPLIIKGPLAGGSAAFSGEDSQPVSALLIACSLAKGKTELTVANPGEIPWVQMTLSWLDRLGVEYENQNFERYTLLGGAEFNAFDFTVPGDWSSVAFPIAAALATGSCLSVENIDIKDLQGDKKFVQVLKEMGALIELEEEKKRLHVKAGKKLKGITVDVNSFIDTVPILAVVACFSEGKTQLLNASSARKKECDRLHCIAKELRKMGAAIVELKDSLVIEGSSLKGAAVNSFGDHRMAMALSVAALFAEGDSVVQGVECVEKTFPHFAKNFCSIGADLKEMLQ